jgi:hypothetical protein
VRCSAAQLRWGEEKKVPPTSQGDRQLCCCTTDQPVHSPRLPPNPGEEEEPAAAAGRTSDGDATEADQAHAAVPRDHHRQVPVRSPLPLLAGFLFLFCRLINCPALVTYWGSQPLSGFRTGRTAGRSRTGICASTRTASASSRGGREAR